MHQMMWYNILMSSIIKQSVIRGAIPLVIMTAISISLHFQSTDPAQAKSTFISGLIISFVAAASVIYEIRQWTFLKQSMIHFLIMLVTVFPCLLLSGWFKLRTLIDYIVVLGVFLLSGLLLWGCGYLFFGKIFNK